MKKLIALLLCALLLTACSNKPPTSAETTVPTTQRLETTPSTTQATETAEPTDATEDGSLHVKTDFSQYESKERPTPLYTRLSPDPLTNLQPTDGSKQIYPFAGKKRYADIYWDLNNNPIYSYTYGFVDETGCILVDPIYSNVVALKDDSTEEFLPIWVFTREDDSSMGFAAMDGSFVTECKYHSIYSNDGRILAFQNQWDIAPTIFEVYDLSGNLLFISDDLPIASKLSGRTDHFQYGEDLYVVSLDPLTMDNSSNEYSNVYFMDEKGELLLGPYYNAYPFSNGLAYVQLEDDTWVYIDKTGAISDKAGISAYTYPDGVYSVWDSTNDKTTWYSPEGEFLWKEYDCSSLNSYLGVTGSYIKNFKTSQTYPLPQDASCYCVGDPLNPIIVACYFVSGVGYCCTYLNDQFQELAYVEEQDYLFPSYYEVGNLSSNCVPLIKEGRTELYYSGSTSIATYPVESFDHFEAYPGTVGAFTDQYYTRLYTADGTLFFSYPSGTMDD